MTRFYNKPMLLIGKVRALWALSITHIIHRSHRIRMETEAKANNRHCFLGENDRPLGLCSRRIDKGGPGQCYRNKCFDLNSSDKSLFILSAGSVALWTVNLKTPGSNPLNNSRVGVYRIVYQSMTVCLGFCIHHY